jgi:hypothetical protein
MKFFFPCFVILMVMFSNWINDAAAQEVTPVSERTPQVRDAIVAEAGVATANEVTEAHLAVIAQLDLSGQNITALKDGDFDGLYNLIELDLAGNQLSTVPEGNPLGFFRDLTELTYLDLSFNQFSIAIWYL